MIRQIATLAIIFGVIATITACAIDPYTGEEKVSNTAIGAGVGAAAGAAIGGAVDGGSGAWKGAIAGTAAGAGVGYYMDRQEKILRLKLERSGVRVHREGDNLRLIMPGDITFDTGKYTIQSHFYNVLNSLGTVINEFDKTMVEISGHTDTTGGVALNQRLSGQRANAVATFLSAQGVYSNRIFTQGFGSSQPRATNKTPQGRQANRRVEIRLLPGSN
jgi:outer membrane protein OmpA-like peptidoglycan-associated protein